MKVGVTKSKITIQFTAWEWKKLANILMRYRDMERAHFLDFNLEESNFSVKILRSVTEGINSI